jgi:hypothetical protein
LFSNNRCNNNNKFNKLNPNREGEVAILIILFFHSIMDLGKAEDTVWDYEEDGENVLDLKVVEEIVVGVVSQLGLKVEVQFSLKVIAMQLILPKLILFLTQ